MRAKIKIIWAPLDLKIMKTYFDECTLDKLLEKVNQVRDRPVEIGALRHQLYRMELTHSLQIRWNKADIKYLVENFKTKSNEEIARDLIQLNRTYRVINGEKVYRKFTRKHVEKKLMLLHYKRSDEEFKFIKKRNIDIGISPAFTSIDNLWTRGIKIATKQEETIIRMHGKDFRRFVKIDSSLIPYSRWFYQKFIGPISEGYIVAHRDMDCLNDNPDNLYLRKPKRIADKEYKDSLLLLQKREQQLLKSINANRDLKTEKELMGSLWRIRKLQRTIKLRIKPDSVQHVQTEFVGEYQYF